MRPVSRDSILGYVTYEQQRDAQRPRVLQEKKRRRVHVGEFLTFLFETTETIRYQVQEMMRVERLVRDADIQHELDTYNELLGDEGELGCTLLIEIDDPALRQEKLTRWLGLPSRIYVLLPDGTRVHARYDDRQVGDARLSSVQYLKFATGGVGPVAVGCDHPDVSSETVLGDDQQRALADDLAG